MAFYKISYGNKKEGRKVVGPGRFQSNKKHWNYSKEEDERDGYKVKIKTDRKTGKVSSYKASHPNGDFYIAQLKTEPRKKIRKY